MGLWGRGTHIKLSGRGRRECFDHDFKRAQLSAASSATWTVSHDGLEFAAILDSTFAEVRLGSRR